MTELVNLRDHMTSAFITPLVTYPWPDSESLNADLRSLILGLEVESESDQARSNVGGWRSRHDLLDREDECIGRLRERIEALVLEMTRASAGGDAGSVQAKFRMHGWANIMRAGDYHVLHSHPGNMWSGVYYVSSGTATPEHPQSGALELTDPRAGVSMIPMPGEPFGRRYMIRPENGAMVLFPSWLQHFVHPYRGEGERIAISFNVSVSGYRRVEQAVS